MNPSRFRVLFCLAFMFLLSSAAWPQPHAPTISLAVDASEAPRKIFHAQLKIPASPGTLTLYSPKWIPGEHGPTGPIQDPAGPTSDDLTYEASLRLPAGWKFGTPLPVASQSGAEIKFKPASLTTLVDSPVIAGEYLRVVPLAENPHQEMDIAADSAAALDA